MKQITVRDNVLKSDPLVAHSSLCVSENDIKLEIEFEKMKMYRECQKRKAGKDMFDDNF